MCLRFVYLLVLGVFSWLRLVTREGAWKDAEVQLVAILPTDLNPHPGHGDHATSNRPTMVIMQPLA
jgi:hypothetical protein